MNDKSYNDAEVLKRYLEKSVKFLMTNFERRSYYLAIKRELAKGLLADQLPRWLAKETDEVRKRPWQARTSFDKVSWIAL